MTTARKKAPALPVPKTQAEAERLLGRIGELQREISTIETEMNELLAETKERYAEAARPRNEEIEMTFAALHAWAEAHREELCPGRGKTAKLATGEISWRVTPPAVSIRQADVVLARLKAMGLTDFIRTKEEIDKARILAEPERVEAVKGISITAREEFIAKPLETQIERALMVKAA
ncbi:MAG: host-nuclease inhibitor Gam family protein [Gammaproteobacteria bacterium]|nr:host-nuclease inhibitor Gam family protein [Gammaproteobacteria bacterium]